MNKGLKDTELLSDVMWDKNYHQNQNRLNPVQISYILFGSDIFMSRGGIADYTDNFAKQLHSHGMLLKVISPFAQKADRSYEVQNFKFTYFRKDSFLDKWWLTRKGVTLLHFVQQFYQSVTGLRRLVKDKENTTIIFTEYYTKQFDIIIYCARLLHIKYAIVFHGLDLIVGHLKEFGYFKNNIIDAHFVVFNSESTAKLCKTVLNLMPDRSIILYPGIDIESIENNCLLDYKGRKFSNGEDCLVFSTVSRLVPRKGIDIAVRIVHGLAQKNIKVRYYIGGVGSEMEALHYLIGELGAENYIHLMGELSDAEKYDLLRTSDFFLLPNHSAGNTDFEGFGISFIEASYFGNVVIGGKHGGVKEAVSDGATGFLFDFDDPDSITKVQDAICSLLMQPDKIKYIKAKGTSFVAEKFDWNNLIQQFVQFEKEQLS